MRMRRLVPALLALALALPAGAARASSPACASFDTASFAAGSIGCVAYDSDALGGTTTFNYYVPPSCDATDPCPVLYLLHGFGGNANEMVGTTLDAPGPFVPYDTDPIRFILISPDGRTPVPDHVDGSPPAGEESFWIDWNPRRWAHPPRFEQQVVYELPDLVESHFPTMGDDPAWRAIDGVSLGGFGSFKLAFQHPDRYASAGSISGALNMLVGPDVQPVAPRAPVGGAPVSTTYTQGPEVIQTPPGFPFGDPFGAFGDLVSDEAYFRGNNPLDLAIDATALPAGASGPALRFFSNDLTPADQSDATNPSTLLSGAPLESVVLPMNTQMRAALTQDGVPFTYELHAGSHEWKYWQPYVRAQLEWHWARLGADARPASFDYRSIRNDFSIWGWHVHVDRTPQEFLTMWNVGARALTISGSGRVTIDTPFTFGDATIQTGALTIVDEGHARRTLSLYLGDSGPTDEHLGASGVPGTVHTATITFSN